MFFFPLFGSVSCPNRLGFTDALQGLANKLFPTLFPENYSFRERKNFPRNALQSDGIKRGSPPLRLENQSAKGGNGPDKRQEVEIEKGEGDGRRLTDRDGYKGERAGGGFARQTHRPATVSGDPSESIPAHHIYNDTDRGRIAPSPVSVCPSLMFQVAERHPYRILAEILDAVIVFNRFIRTIERIARLVGEKIRL